MKEKVFLSVEKKIDGKVLVAFFWEKLDGFFGSWGSFQFKSLHWDQKLNAHENLGSFLMWKLCFLMF